MLSLPGFRALVPCLILLMAGCATRESCTFRGAVQQPGRERSSGVWDILQHRGFERPDGRRQIVLLLPPLKGTLNLSFLAPDESGRAAARRSLPFEAWIEEASPAGARLYIGSAPPRRVDLTGNATLAYDNDARFTLTADLRSEGERAYLVQGKLIAYSGPDAVLTAGTLGASLFSIGSPLLMGALMLP